MPESFQRAILARRIRQYTFKANYSNVLDPKDIIDQFCKTQIIQKEKISGSEYKLLIESDAQIVVVSVGDAIKAAAGGGGAGAALGLVGARGGGAGAGIGALIGIIGGPIGVAIGAGIGGGVGAAVGGATGVIPGAGFGAWAARKFGKDITIPMKALLPQIVEVETDSDKGKMIVKMKIHPCPQQK